MGKLFLAISLKDDKIICNKKIFLSDLFSKINNNHGIQKRKISFNIQDSIPKLIILIRNWKIYITKI